MEAKIATRLLLFCLLFPFFVADAQPNLKYEEEQVDEIFSEWDQPASPGCAVGIYSEGEIMFSKGYGEAVLEENEPITPETVFYAGSVSKQFAAATVILLSLRGEINLDSPVREYIPEMPEYPENRDPTVGELIHHTSGLPDLYALLSLYDISLEDELPFETMVEIITDQSHLNFKPGSEYLYSNSGYTLLAELVKRVSGQSFQEFTTDHLFEPLGMYNTHFHDDPSHVVEAGALSYQPDGDEFKKSYLPNFEGVGPGGLYTTIEDMIQWDRQLYDNQLSQAEDFNSAMHRQAVLSDGDTLSYASGLQINEYKGVQTVGHGGSFMGFKADYLRLPDQQYGSVLLCNLGNINPSDLNKQIADHIFEDLFEEELSKYAGIYYSEELDLEFELEVKNGTLYLNRESAPSGKLIYQDKNTFRSGSWELKFNYTSFDMPDEFILSSSRAKNISFKKSR